MTPTTECTCEEKQAALKRALESRTFARSGQLKAFLRFVCEAEMKGTSADLTEYVIGVEVLGKAEGYSPAEDSSVRTRAYELRQKLNKLYTMELAGEPVQIAIVKGSYAPHFERLAVPTEEERAALAAPLPEPQPAPARRRSPAAALLLTLVLGAGVGASLRSLPALRPSEKSEIDPLVAEAWRPMVRSGANVALSVAAPLHMILGPSGRTNHGLPAYPAPPETYPLYRQHRPLAPNAQLDMTFTDNALGFGTMNAVVTTVNTLRALGATYQVLPDRAVPLSAVRERNAVLFGGPLDSETINRTVETVPLYVDFERAEKSFVIRDRTSGKLMVPRHDGNDGFSDVYGLATVLNTRDSSHGRLGMVIFSGTNSAGTDGAAQFMSSPQSLRRLREIFGREGVTGFPAAYQVVVRCTFGDLVMISYEYAAHRILQR